MAKPQLWEKSGVPTAKTALFEYDFHAEFQAEAIGTLVELKS